MTRDEIKNRRDLLHGIEMALNYIDMRKDDYLEYEYDENGNRLEETGKVSEWRVDDYNAVCQLEKFILSNMK